MVCTLGAFPALAFADDKKSSRKIKHKKIPSVHKCSSRKNKKKENSEEGRIMADMKIKELEQMIGYTFRDPKMLLHMR